MKSILSKILLVSLFAFSGLASIGVAQSPAEPTRPDDRLPFMQKEQTATAPAEPSTGGLLIKSFGAMILIIGLIFFGAWGLKKFGFGKFKTNESADSPALSIVSTLSVGTNCNLSIIQFGQRTLLVGSTPQSFTLLADEMNEAEFSAMNSRSVAEMLAEETSFAEELERKVDFWEKGGRVS
jgi:flagellar biosynthetic protein FliO